MDNGSIKVSIKSPLEPVQCRYSPKYMSAKRCCEKKKINILIKQCGESLDENRAKLITLNLKEKTFVSTKYFCH